jgi:hypothetical protein
MRPSTSRHHTGILSRSGPIARKIQFVLQMHREDLAMSSPDFRRILPLTPHLQANRFMGVELLMTGGSMTSTNGQWRRDDARQGSFVRVTLARWRPQPRLLRMAVSEAPF